ncbi:alpha/beta hydrolase [Clostridium sp. BJN0001]|uniref:alpha/beta fold hydrolase n=1 Tax=Clostridium sp. BJN0001 TaxID=2930219 RepID=UPI001FD4CEDD|nr:alpha/beta hydrolase [Clostridium sp. BJN0001]
MINYKKFYKEENRETILFIHAFGGNSNVFKKQIDDFSKKYNIILIDLRSHGLSKDVKLTDLKSPTIEKIAEEIIELLDLLKIDKVHLLGLSIGTMIIAVLTTMIKKRILSVIALGNTTSFNNTARILLKTGYIFKNFISFKFLYICFVNILIPKSNHKLSRKMFIREATKMDRKEFIAWYKIIIDFEKFHPVSSFHNNIPKLFVMGDSDHMFLKPTIKFAKEDENSEIHVIKNGGHIINIDCPDEVNKISLNFLKNLK